MTVLQNQNKAREDLKVEFIKRFNLIERNQIVGPGSFFDIWETFWSGFRIVVRFRAGTSNNKRTSCVLLGPTILSLGLTVLGVFTGTSKHTENCQT